MQPTSASFLETSGNAKEDTVYKSVAKIKTFHDNNVGHPELTEDFVLRVMKNVGVRNQIEYFASLFRFGTVWELHSRCIMRCVSVFMCSVVLVTYCFVSVCCLPQHSVVLWQTTTDTDTMNIITMLHVKTNDNTTEQNTNTHTHTYTHKRPLTTPNTHQHNTFAETHTTHYTHKTHVLHHTVRSHFVSALRMTTQQTFPVLVHMRCLRTMS